MKKIIAAIIRVIIPKVVRKHEREKESKRIHNAYIMQDLLDNEHSGKESVVKKKLEFDMEVHSCILIKEI